MGFFLVALQGQVAGTRGPWRPYPPAPTSSFPHAGTEFEYTDSESEVKVPKQSAAGLLRTKKGVGEPGQSLAAPGPGSRASGPSSPDKAKLVSEKGRKARKIRGPKEPGFEAGPEASDDDLWTRRRSERIFLHDASAAVQATSNTAPATKPSRCGRGGAPSPRKDTGRAKDRKDPRKVRSLAQVPWSPSLGYGFDVSSVPIEGSTMFGVQGSRKPCFLFLFLTEGLSLSSHKYNGLKCE